MHITVKGPMGRKALSPASKAESNKAKHARYNKKRPQLAKKKKHREAQARYEARKKQAQMSATAPPSPSIPIQGILPTNPVQVAPTPMRGSSPKSVPLTPVQKERILDTHKQEEQDEDSFISFLDKNQELLETNTNHRMEVFRKRKARQEVVRQIIASPSPAKRMASAGDTPFPTPPSKRFCPNANIHASSLSPLPSPNPFSNGSATFNIGRSSPRGNNRKSRLNASRKKAPPPVHRTLSFAVPPTVANQKKKAPPTPINLLNPGAASQHPLPTTAPTAPLTFNRTFPSSGQGATSQHQPMKIDLMANSATLPTYVPPAPSQTFLQICTTFDHLEKDITPASARDVLNKLDEIYPHLNGTTLSEQEKAKIHSRGTEIHRRAKDVLAQCDVQSWTPNAVGITSDSSSKAISDGYRQAFACLGKK